MAVLRNGFVYEDYDDLTPEPKKVYHPYSFIHGLYSIGEVTYTSEQFDRLISKKKKEDKQRYDDYCIENPEGPPYIDEFDKVCHGAEYLGDGGGVGLFCPETEEEWDERMAGWKFACRKRREFNPIDPIVFEICGYSCSFNKGDTININYLMPKEQ